MGWKKFWDEKGRYESTIRNGFADPDETNLRQEISDAMRGSFINSDNYRILDITTDLELRNGDILISTKMGAKGRKWAKYGPIIIALIVFMFSLYLLALIRPRGLEVLSFVFLDLVIITTIYIGAKFASYHYILTQHREIRKLLVDKVEKSEKAYPSPWL